MDVWLLKTFKDSVYLALDSVSSLVYAFLLRICVYEKVYKVSVCFYACILEVIYQLVAI